MGFILEQSLSLLEIYRENDPDQRAAFERLEAERTATGRGRRIDAERYPNLRITIYPGDSAIVSALRESGDIHFAVRHPKILYAIAHMS